MFTWEEIKQANGKLLKVYATSIACLLVKRKVLENTVFRSHPTFIYGEDLWWYAEVNDKGFEMYCDTEIRAKHINRDWQNVPTYQKPNFWVAIGPYIEDKTGYTIDVIRRDKNGRRS